MASAGAREYNGGLGRAEVKKAELPVGVLKLKAFEHLGIKRRSQICQLFCILQIQQSRRKPE